MNETSRGKTSNVFYEYMSNATIHGLNRIVGIKLYTGRSLLWTLIVMSSAVGLGVVIYRELDYFYSRPSLLKEYISKPGSLDIPSVTFCPLKAFDGSLNRTTEAATEEEMIFQRMMYPLADIPQTFLATLHNTLLGWNKDNNDSLFDSYRFFREHNLVGPYDTFRENGIPEVFYSNMSGVFLDTIMKESTVLTIMACPEVRSFEYSLKCCNKIVTDIITEVGKCKTVNVTALLEKEETKNLVQGDDVIIIFNVDMEFDMQLFHPHGINVIVHSPYEPPLPTIRGTFIPSTSIATVNMVKTTRISLGPPYKTPDGQTCSASEQDMPRLVRFPEYPYSVAICQRECLVNYTVETCGCRHPWDPGNEEVCSFMEIYDCTWKTTDLFISNFSESCNCPQPCQTSEYSINLDYSPLQIQLDKPLQLSKNGNGIDRTVCPVLFDLEILELGSGPEQILVVVVKFPTSIRVLEQVPIKEFVDVLSSLGGLIGLFLGFSIISLVEITEMIMLSLRRMCCRRQEKISPPKPKQTDKVEIENIE